MAKQTSSGRLKRVLVSGLLFCVGIATVVLLISRRPEPAPITVAARVAVLKVEQKNDELAIYLTGPTRFDFVKLPNWSGPGEVAIDFPGAWRTGALDYPPLADGPFESVWVGGYRNSGDSGVRVLMRVAGAWLLSQTDCRLVPRVLAVARGQRLRLSNRDGVAHEIRATLDSNLVFSVTLGPGEALDQELSDLGSGTLMLNSVGLPWTRAFVRQVIGPYFAVTDGQGQYGIRDLPPGTYNVEAWHERRGSATLDVTVVPYRQARADFAFVSLR